VSVLIYAGLRDFQCAWGHQVSWSSKLAWSGHDGFNAQKLEPWYMNRNATEARNRGKEAKGEAKTFGRLTLASIRGAGHMCVVPTLLPSSRRRR
jgi:cathepsin A (carboxypeptidase C)